MQVVSQRAMQIADRGSALAERGMLFSARTELLKALQLIAQALDAQEASTQHSAALAAGLTALEEACEFSHAANRPAEATDVAVIAASHRTPLLQSFESMSNSPIVAQQQYFSQAQAQLTLAAGGVAAASQILYRLGRLQTALSIHDADPLALHGPRSLVYHQAAMATDSGNWLAANELGVLLARYGQLPEARQLLVHSVTVHPHLEGWHNLSVVHRRLGEADLASRAENEWKLLAQQSGKSRTRSNQMVQWVDTKTFASSGGGDVHWPATVAAKPAASSVSPVRR
jgi:tetratricopeptide (TPR) repeat protein